MKIAVLTAILLSGAVIWMAPAQRPPEGKKGQKKGPGPIKPRMPDTIKASVYVDNWFMMYINGKLI